MFNSEAGTVSLAIALAAIIVSRRGGGSAKKD